MSKKNLFILLLFISVVLAGCGQQISSVKNNNQAEQKNEAVTKNKVNYGETSIAPETVEKIQVFSFHSTQRCSTCIAIGKLAGETINERFQDELKSGKIEFREINIDLPENKELAKKFRASGSSLFINTITDNEDYIAQDTRVWRLTSDPVAFKDYLQTKINKLFGK
jgi:hypothetical protein